MVNKSWGRTWGMLWWVVRVAFRTWVIVANRVVSGWVVVRKHTFPCRLLLTARIAREASFSKSICCIWAYDTSTRLLIKVALLLTSATSAAWPWSSILYNVRLDALLVLLSCRSFLPELHLLWIWTLFCPTNHRSLLLILFIDRGQFMVAGSLRSCCDNWFTICFILTAIINFLTDNPTLLPKLHLGELFSAWLRGFYFPAHPPMTYHDVSVEIGPMESFKVCKLKNCVEHLESTIFTFSL